jgi:conjugal transfer pilus assembly protein TraE
MVLSILLALLAFKNINRERIVLVPAGFHQEAWVSDAGVSASYLSQMSLMLSNLRLNLSPETLAESHKLLLQYVDSSAVGPLRQTLVEEGDRIAQEHVSTAFYVTNIAVDVTHFLVEVKGRLVSTVGKIILPEKYVTYELKYRYRDGQLFLIRFQEKNVELIKEVDDENEAGIVGADKKLPSHDGELSPSSSH